MLGNYVHLSNSVPFGLVPSAILMKVFGLDECRCYLSHKILVETKNPELVKSVIALYFIFSEIGSQDVVLARLCGPKNK